MAWLDDDLPIYFTLKSAGGFADSAVWTPVAGGGPFTIEVLFDDDYDGIGVGEADQAGRDVQCSARNDQIAQGSGMKRGDTIVINAVTWKVGTVHKNSATGVSRISLRK